MNSAPDAVVVGGGTVGGWAAVMLAEAGRSVVLLEAATLGSGASSRAAGMVRAQGGTEAAIRLGMFSRDFYQGQRERYPLDSGFVAQGYLMPCFTADEFVAARERVTLQRSLGLDVELLDAEELDQRHTGLAPGVALGASYAPGDGYLDAPRNVLAYTAALLDRGVDIREHCRFGGLCFDDDGAVNGVRTSDGDLATRAVVLTGGPDLAAVGQLAGGRIHAGGTRHQAVVTSPVPGVDLHALPMVFDVSSGIYWRPGEYGGLLWGMSNPDEPPGPARDFDADYFAAMRARVEQLFPAARGLAVRRSWAATIDYTPDHLPIIGPLLRDGTPVHGTVIASAAGHGMMWGPGVARAAADLVLTGSTELLDVSQLGLDRFDTDGRSRLAADPIALPFPQRTCP
ncbi:MAG TPA: FAD-binding oxidoreductase [Jatrophihabitans sp.]|jgi:sarcosine oxidase subunit beta|nr:FAD-binding oxidoreductase [Jatrophihabitans sp.]